MTIIMSNCSTYSIYPIILLPYRSAIYSKIEAVNGARAMLVVTLLLLVTSVSVSVS